MSALLEIENLSLAIGDTPVLDQVSFSVERGEIFGLVGPSGSGKSMTALAVMGLAPRRAKVSGHIRLDGDDLLTKTDREMYAIRGRRVAMIFQEPMSALNPLQPIGAQVAETILLHTDRSRREATQEAIGLLRRVGLAPETIPPNRYPHELSGGQRQRVVIAIAIAMTPDLIVADEPTTALDASTEAQILQLLREISRENGAAMILITHNTAVTDAMTDRVATMNKGRITVIQSAREPLRDENNVPPPAPLAPTPDQSYPPALTARDIVCAYPRPKQHLFEAQQWTRAVNSVSLEIRPGEIVGLVGESGCGKSTLARALLGLESLRSGTLQVGGSAFPVKDKQAMRRARRKIQIVFQDPADSFNPRMKVTDIIAEPCHLFADPEKRASARASIPALLERVGLPKDAGARYPHEFSGGQRQRIAIARALISEPEIIILDEPTSALDVATRDRILTLLGDLAIDKQLAFLFITHDLATVRGFAHRSMVMQNGEIIEEGPTAALFSNPTHVYTKTLIDAMPKPLPPKNREDRNAS